MSFHRCASLVLALVVSACALSAGTTTKYGTGYPGGVIEVTLRGSGR